MVSLSRRHFIQLLGVSFAATALPSWVLPATAASSPIVSVPLQGRVLAFSAPLFPSVYSTRPTTFLNPDHILPIHEHDQELYKTTGGYVLRDMVQPVLLRESTSILPPLPFYAEVCAPVAALRRWCAPNAPLVTRVGNGGVLLATHFLPDERAGWLQFADEKGDALGWSPAKRWRAIEVMPPPQGDRHVTVSLRERQLHAIENGERLFTAPISLNEALTPGRYTIASRTSSSTVNLTDEIDSIVSDAPIGYGAPWHIDFGAGSWYGAYWHNRFGSASPSSDSISAGLPTLEISPIVARWLYAWLPNDGQVIIT